MIEIGACFGRPKLDLFATVVLEPTNPIQSADEVQYATRSLLQGRESGADGGVIMLQTAGEGTELRK